MNTWSFDNDELFELVRCGRKTATCAVLDNEPLSSPGDVEQIINSKGEISKIQITKVEIKRFCDIDATWAKKKAKVICHWHIGKRCIKISLRNIMKTLPQK